MRFAEVVIREIQRDRSFKIFQLFTGISTLKPLEKPDAFHLSAAVGWLELGNWQEANEELERIAPQLRAHPSALGLRWEIYRRAGNWDLGAAVAETMRKMEPGEVGWALNLAYAARRREGGGLEAAKAILADAQRQFPTEPMVPYNLACYGCQLGDLKAAWSLLEKAFKTGDAKKIKLMALHDPDLEPFWKRIGEI